MEDIIKCSKCGFETNNIKESKGYWLYILKTKLWVCPDCRDKEEQVTHEHKTKTHHY